MNPLILVVKNILIEKLLETFMRWLKRKLIKILKRELIEQINEAMDKAVLKIKQSKTKIDDKALLPVIKVFREEVVDKINGF